MGHSYVQSRQFHSHAGIMTLCLIVLAGGCPESSPAAQLLETVSGTGCYRYGDDQTPALAKRAALALAQEQAVRSHRVFVSSQSTVKNFQLEEDIVTTASSGMLEQVRIERQDINGQEICVSISANLSPGKLDNVIQQKTKAQRVANSAQMPVLTMGSGFELKLWTNKQEKDVFAEGDDLEISVRSSRDAFLKVDYYQADGTVVHLVPNMFVDDAFIQAGKTYTFGGRHSRAGFRITGPFGSETVKAVASTHSLDTGLASENATDESQAYLDRFHAKMRGIQVVANPGQAAQWAESSFSLTTRSRNTLEHEQIISSRHK